jgi:ATP-binding cassette, subfamily B, bacterial
MSEKKEETKKLSYKERLKTLKLILKWSYKSSPTIFIWIIILSIISGLIVVVTPYIYKILIDYLTSLNLEITTKITTTIILIIFLYLLTILGSYIFNEINYLLRIKMNLRIDRFASKQLMKKTTTLDLEHFEDSEFYDNLYRANLAIPKIQEILRDFITVFRFLISVLAILISLTVYDIKITLLVLIGAIPYLIVSLRYTNINYNIFTANSKEKRKAKYYLNLINTDKKSVKEIKLFSLKNTFLTKFEKLFKIAIKRQDKVINKQIREISLSIVFNMITMLVALAISTNLYIKGQITIGTIVFLFALITDFAYNMGILFEVFGYLNSSVTEANSLREVLKYKSKIIQNKNTKFSKTLKTGIIFKDVYFKYPKTEKYVLKDINLKIKPGENIAIVGENGSGKTTFIKILTRLYDTTKGEIIIENKNIKEYKLSEIHKNIGVIFQDFVQYEATVKENIHFGDAYKSPKTIEHSAIKSGAHNFIKEFDKKYLENLGRTIEKDGKELSGGQWQKIALARAFFKNSKILILDEPTAAIDAKAEYELFKRFKSLTKNKTTILISHRFSTVKMADRIIVMDKGRIVEEGSHKELMEKKGVYHNLFTLQAKGYQL